MNDKYIKPLIRILGGLVADDDNRRTQVVLDSGFIHFLLPFIHSPSVHVRKESFWLLSNKCLEEKSSRVCWQALWCICNLLMRGNKSQIFKFVNAGCISCLVKYLHCSKEKEILAALEGLESLLLTHNQISDNHVKDVFDELKKLKGLDRLKQIQTMESVSGEICQKSKSLVEIIQFRK